jgi:hypothetical protein
VRDPNTVADLKGLLISIEIIEIRARVEVKGSAPRSLWSAFQLVVIGNCTQGLRLRGASCAQPIIEIIEISLCLGELIRALII